MEEKKVDPIGDFKEFMSAIANMEVGDKSGTGFRRNKISPSDLLIYEFRTISRLC